MRVTGRQTQRRNESEDRLDRLIRDLSLLERTVAPSGLLVSRAEEEHTRWDPKDGELCLSRAKPEETLVEVRSGSDVQIDRQTCV